MRNTLDNLFKANKCDKITHFYHKEYEKHFKTIQNDPINLLEIGIWEGTSHQSWIEYFPNAQIYGIDVFERVDPDDVQILMHPRLHWIKGDSTVPEIQDQIKKEWGNVKFDVIIDDGLHTPKANRLTFENMIKFKNEQAVYYIEDVWPLHKMTALQLNHPWIQKKTNEYNKEEWDKFYDTISSKSFLVAELDYRRNSNKPDSYLMKIEI